MCLRRGQGLVAARATEAPVCHSQSSRSLSGTRCSRRQGRRRRSRRPAGSGMCLRRVRQGRHEQGRHEQGRHEQGRHEVPTGPAARLGAGVRRSKPRPGPRARSGPTSVARRVGGLLRHLRRSRHRRRSRRQARLGALSGRRPRPVHRRSPHRAHPVGLQIHSGGSDRSRPALPKGGEQRARC